MRALDKDIGARIVDDLWRLLARTDALYCEVVETRLRFVRVEDHPVTDGNEAHPIARCRLPLKIAHDVRFALRLVVRSRDELIGRHCICRRLRLPSFFCLIVQPPLSSERRDR